MGIIDPAPDIAPPTPVKTTVYNPVEAVQQMGTPPTVAVGNYSMALNALPASTLEPGDWDDTYIAKNAVFRRDGDLWVADSPFSETAGGGHSALLRNLFTGERKQYTLYDGEDEFLDTYTTANVDVLIDNAQPSRDLAVAEIVARTTDLSVAGLDHWKVNLEGDPDGMRYGSEGQINWPTFVRNVERGRLGKDNDRPLMHEDGSLWKVEHAPTHEGDNLILTNSVNGKSVTLNESVFKATGTWFVASNDTTAAVWQSKFAPVEDHGDADPGGIKQSQDHQIAVAKGELDEFPDQPETPTVGGPGDDGFSDAVEIPTTPTAVDIANDPNLSNLEAEEAIAALQVDEADADLMAASEPTAGSQKLVHGVLAGMSPGEPLLSTEMQVSDLDALKAQLVGKHVVTLPIEAYENPDWEGYDLGAVNGTGTVTDVVQSASGKIGVKVSKPYGGYTWVIGGDASKFPKVVIPVEQAPTIQQVVFKKNGDIFINGTKVGTQYGYKGVIDGDHSITGKAMHFEVKSGKQNLKNAASSLVNPIMPVPTTKKNVKELATETKVKELNLKLEATKTAIAMTEQELADLATGEIVGEGNPLNDGSKPAKGDWVFSVKDGSYAQVLNPNVVGFAGKGVLSPDMIKVKIQDPVTGKWKQSNRKREQLVSAAGPGEPPFVLSTKAILDATGGYIGPGTTAYFGYEGANVLVLDTTTNGHAKVRMSDGSEKWVDASSYLSVASGTPAPSLKAPASGVSDSAKADLLNTQLDALNDEAVALLDTIAATLATPTAKKKQATGTPYPGPDGATFKQPSWLAEQREAQGLKNMKDGYVPAPGMVLRHNDGTQYIVYEMGSAGSSHKNSVLVAPASNPTDTKWRALSTMVVDHEGMLTDKGGNPLPVISQIEGADFAPESGLLISKPYLKSYATGQKDAKGYPEYRQKSIARFFIVGYDGTVYNVDGSKASAYALQPTYNSTDPPERIGYIDKSAPAGKKLTISIQASTHPAQNGYAQYAVIHEPGEDAAIPLAKQAVVQPNPQATTVGPAPPGYVYNPLTGVYEPEPTPTPAAPTPTPTPPAPAVPATPPTAATPSAPYTAPDVTVSPTPTDELPVFTGSSPAGMEVPHPPTTSSAKAVPVFKPTGGPPTLDVTNLAGAHAVTHAIAQATEIAKANKASGKKDWVGTYSLADGDSIEDMMVRVQIVRDKKGVEFVEVSFRLDIPAARKAHTTFMTSSKNEAGDWEQVNRNATNLVPGDKMSLRIASGGGMTPKGGLRPDENGTIPNATVVAAPVLIGKNKAGTLDVYRTQVITAGGDIGFIDVEDRNGEDTLVIFDWDATKPRTTNASKSLNPNAAADGWAVKTHQLTWASSGNWQVSDIESDGVKTMATKSVASAPYSGSTSGGVEFGAGSVLTRDYQDVHIEYATSPVKNSLDGQTVMRVRADDPDAQRKLADAMELVGVTREKQQPPDKEALVKMATTKVWEQFGATYTRGKSPNSPQDALDAIDKAVGTQLGRPATMDDISVRITKDGRVQVLVSEDVSRAVVKKNGVKSYLHQFMGTHKLDMLESIISNESPTLMSTTERFQNGIFITGMSSGKDHKHDSADHLFLTMDKGGNSGTSGSATIDAVTLHRHVDYYYQPGDSYGERQSNQLNWLNSPGHGELMMQRRFEADLITYVRLSDSDRTALIKKLNARGITTAPNGKPLEEFLLDYTPQKFPPTDFGDEITLAALPDTTAAPALAGV
ncbi:MAG TPA: hypothetical protein VFP09_10725 [Desertimonas sp.]|nr:hypothetical protein [Desertimonas sp.]